MIKLLKKMSKNKIFYVFVFLVIILFPGTLYKTAQSESRAILTAVAIDKIDNELEITSTVLTPGGGTKFSDNLQIVSAKGDSISDCFEKISSNLGKTIGLAHAELIVLGDEIIKDNAYKYLNYFISTNNLTTNAVIVNSKVAKDVLIVDKENPALANTTAKQIVQYDSQYHQSVQTNLDRFFLDYFSTSALTMLPRLEVVELDETNKESSSENSEALTQSQNDQSSSDNKSQSGESGGSNKIIQNNGKMVLLKKGTLVAELDGETNKMFYLLKNPKNKGTFQVDNINDKFVKDGNVILEVVRKNTITKTDFINGKPFVYFNIFMVLKLDEYVVSSDNINSIDSTQSKITPQVKDAVEEKIKTKTAEIFEICREKDVDMFGLYKKFNAYHNREFKEFMKNRTFSDFLNELNISMDITIRGKI